MKKLFACLVASMIATPAFAEYEDIEFPFWAETNQNSTAFSIDALGTFFIDWGDGTEIERVERTNVDNASSERRTFSHRYNDNITTHRIRLGGKATGYETNITDGNNSAIFFEGCGSFDVEKCDSCTLSAIGGCLGCIFPTIGDGDEPGQQPRFYRTFAGCPNMTGEIPADLFKGVHGKPINHMFFWTFAKSPFSGTIPEDLFADIEGAPTSNIFNNTFTRTNLSGEIPVGLFRGIRGAPAPQMFSGTFSVNKGLNGTLPGDLFAGIKGAPTVDMFRWAFYDTKITEIGDGLLSGISGPSVTNSFDAMFTGGTPISCMPNDLFDGITGVNLSTVFSPVPKKCYCPTECGVGYELGDCECVGLPSCDAGFSQLKTHTGLSFPLYARPCTSPALYFGYGDKVCTACLVKDAAPNSINIQIGDDTYHVVDPTAK